MGQGKSQFTEEELQDYDLNISRYAKYAIVVIFE